MSNQSTMCMGVVLLAALAATALLASAVAGAQSNDDQAVQSAAKPGVYRDLQANLERMAASRNDKAEIDAAVARMDALLARASPAVRGWLQVEGQQQAHSSPSESAIAAAAQARFGNNLSTVDIDALVQLLFAEIAHDAEQELRDQLAQMRAINQQKQAQRDATQKLRQQQAMQSGANVRFVAAQPGYDRAELFAYVARVSDGKDHLDDMSEIDQMRLQAIMERRQKALEILANLMRKQADTADSIIDNLK